MKRLVAIAISTAISCAAPCGARAAGAETAPSSEGLSRFLKAEAPQTQAAPVCGWVSCYDYCQQSYVWLRGGRCYTSWDSWSGCYKAYTYCR